MGHRRDVFWSAPRYEIPDRRKGLRISPVTKTRTKCVGLKESAHRPSRQLLNQYLNEFHHRRKWKTNETTREDDAVRFKLLSTRGSRLLGFKFCQQRPDNL